MPPQQIGRGPARPQAWHPETSVAQWVVGLPVAEVVAQPVADQHPGLSIDLGDDGQIAPIVEAVKVGPEEKAVGDGVRTAMTEGHDVRRFECGERVLPGQSASTLVCFRRLDAEDPLSEPRPYQPGVSVSRRALAHRR